MRLEEYRFTEKEFEKMTLNPFPLQAKKDMYKKFKHQFDRLGKMGDIFKNPKLKISSDKAITYLAYYCDPESPLNKGSFRENYHEKKTICAQLAEFEVDGSGAFKEKYQDILNGVSKEFNLMVIHFLRLFKNTKWSTLLQVTTLFYQKVLPEGDSGKIKTTGNYIDDLTKQYIEMDPNIPLQREMYAVVEEEIVVTDSLRPEHFAEEEIWAAL